MRALGFILCGLICLATIRLLDPDPAPMMIDGAMLVQAGGEFCDVPKRRAPVLRGPVHDAVPGAVANLKDKGIA